MCTPCFRPCCVPESACTHSIGIAAMFEAALIARADGSARERRGCLLIHLCTSTRTNCSDVSRPSRFYKLLPSCRYLSLGTHLQRIYMSTCMRPSRAKNCRHLIRECPLDSRHTSQVIDVADPDNVWKRQQPTCAHVVKSVLSYSA